MHKPRLILLLSAVLSGYSHLAIGASGDFVIEVNGKPKIEGSGVISLGFGSNRRYSFVTSEASVSVAMPGARLTIRYLETGHTCQNFGDTEIQFDDSRAELSGQVGCRSEEADQGEREEASIQGWFDLE
jgi:hypothetical protein